MSRVRLTGRISVPPPPAEAYVPGLAEFARGYPAYLRSWQDAIAALAGGTGR